MHSNRLQMAAAGGRHPAGKTLAARAVANRTDACFIRVIGSELVQRYVGEGARLVREIFKLAKTKQVGSCPVVLVLLNPACRPPLLGRC